jgi:phage gp36-like protein
MAYVTPGRVRAICIPDGGTSPAGDTVDKATPAGMSEVALGIAIDDAQTVVDAYIGQQVTVPLADPVPPLVETLTAWEAAYLGMLTFRRTKDLEKDDPFRLRHDWALSMLEKIASGAITIPGAGGVSADDPLVVNQYDGYMFLAEDFDLRTPDLPPHRFV